MTVEYSDAIKALGGKNFSVGDDPSIVYYSEGNTKNITTEQIKAKYNELVEADKKLQYQRDRAVAYDPITEQLDQIYHDIDAWKAKIKAVKDKYPKP